MEVIYGFKIYDKESGQWIRRFTDVLLLIARKNGKSSMAVAIALCEVSTDFAGEFTPINMNPPEIKSEVMTFLKSIVRERYGISEALLSGDYNGEQHSAFYQSCLEDLIVEFEQGMSSCLFTQREQDVGHRVKCYNNKTVYLSTANKIELATLATNTGLMTLNEINDIFGFEPFDEGDRRLQSLNFVSTAIIDNYQVNNAGAIKPIEGGNNE